MSRCDVYSWKCDRPAAFHGTGARGRPAAEVGFELAAELERFFGTAAVAVRPGPGQGNHLTFLADPDGLPLLIRVEDGPEQDDHLAVESVVLDRVRNTGVRTPRVFGCDVSRSRVPFAWQALERIDNPDLNHWHKRGLLDAPAIATALGQAVAAWQMITPAGFGVFDTALTGCRRRYADHYELRLDEHLAFLVRHGLLAPPLCAEIVAEIDRHRRLLDLERACLVHKDLALWNVLGGPREITAFIDFDDAIGGDPLDDLSLLACFHGGAFLRQVVAAYAGVRPLPDEHRRRFWMHLLRNMIVKAVIRVGAGYFDRDDGLFLIDSGGSGAELRRFTLARLALALDGLRHDREIDIP